MIYVFDFETAITYGVDNKLKTVLALEMGITYKLDIVFPPGPQHLLHVQIMDGLHPVWPTNPGADFASENEVITFNDTYPLLFPPYELYAYTWNLDDTYKHRIIIRIGIESPRGVARITPERAREAVFEQF